MMDLLLLLTTVTAGLSAGVFFTFTTLIVPGLLDAGDRESLKGFQTIDRRLQPTSPSTTWQPLFGAVVFGTAGLLLLTFGVAVLQSHHSVTLLGAAAVVYNLGFWVPTLRVILPFNNSLRGTDLDAMSGPQLAAIRAEFERAWTSWNLVRSATSSLTLILLVVALGQG